ncbi:conserved hypothetical protein [Methanocaldococcus vulcanius M7]|uniref:Uncharacterized protein n=1 Tax=Methanocaldococcus vulcanius (strain ATCC 700851 / DSM 12094 / M7) TaxID=579137 RepID=C9RIE5_METVM|nr:hypothetical protein [Methanocaldococcus vulcanius]ACX73347.1 conserved hypothetical protein [Methanocaldococcus vulcanius M7]
MNDNIDKNKNDCKNLDLEIALKLDQSINYLLNSAINFRKGNEDMANLISQLNPVLDNVEKTLDIVEDKYNQILERYKNGGSLNPDILEKFVENLENLTHVIENIKKITKNLNLEIEKHSTSISKLDETIAKLKTVNSDASNRVMLEFEKASAIIESNKKMLSEISKKNLALEERLKDLLLDLDNTLNECNH